MKQSATLLHATIRTGLDGPKVVRVTTNPDVPGPEQHALLAEHPVESFGAQLTFGHVLQGSNSVCLPPELDYLAEGDIVRIDPVTERLHVMYRVTSPNNAIFVTERCNSFCVMCSQPPKKADDSAMTREWLKAIPLMSKKTGELGLTGGEPTLLGDLFLELLQCCKENLPDTSLHILSNGRLFNYLSLACAVADMQHRTL